MYRSSLTILAMLTLLVSGEALPQSRTDASRGTAERGTKPLVTFVELGSVKCVPCRQMQAVMASVEKKYGDQISIVFHDVWQADQRHYAEQYGIRVIPTQVFLDKDGKEFHRHEGFYPEAEIDKILQNRGLKVRSGE